jgi:hypothetical protein
MAKRNLELFLAKEEPESKDDFKTVEFSNPRET